MIEEQELPQGWDLITLGDVQEDRSKHIEPHKFPEQYFELYSVPSFDHRRPEIVQGSDIGSSKQVIDVGTVLLCKINPRINRAWVVGNYSDNLKIASTEWIPFFKLSGIVPAYLCYYLRLDAFRVFLASSASGVGGSLMRIRGKTFENYPFPLPSLPEQQRIVEAIEQQFSRLDAGVAALRQAQTKLKRYRASVLKAAVEGKLTEKWRAAHPGVEPANELLKRILAERRAKWEEEQRAKGKDPLKGKYEEPVGVEGRELSELPEGWCWATVETLLLEPPCNGISIKGSEIPPGFPALKLSAMSDRGFDYDDRRYILISDDTAESLAIQKGDFFISRGNGSLRLVGRGTLAQIPPECIVFPDTMIRLRFINIGMLNYFISCIWSSTFVRKQIESRARTTAGIYKISQSDVKAFLLPFPPLAEQEQIVSLVEERLSIVAQLESLIEQALKRAERLRQSILHRAFTGKLVPQDPNDEPASVLLERIHQERAQAEQKKQPPARKPRQERSSSKQTSKVQPEKSWPALPETPRPEPIDQHEVTQSELWQEIQA